MILKYISLVISVLLTELHTTVHAKENVVRLDVTVNDLTHVQELQCLQHFPGRQHTITQ